MSIKTAKQQVMDLIEKKKRYTVKGRAAESKRIGHMKMIGDLFQEFEKIKKNSTNPATFQYDLESTLSVFDRKLRALDPCIHISIIWNNRDEENIQWDQLAIDSIHLVWSNPFLEKNPSYDKEACIDLMQLMLEGYLGD
jgi:hypothetical protein